MCSSSCGNSKGKQGLNKKNVGIEEKPRFTNAAMYEITKGAMTVVCDRQGHVISDALVPPCKVMEAEELAIPLAIRERLHANMPLTILMDSQQVCRNFLLGKSDKPAAKQDKEYSFIQTIIWIPGHFGVYGNLHAYRAARGFVHS